MKLKLQFDPNANAKANTNPNFNMDMDMDMNMNNMNINTNTNDNTITNPKNTTRLASILGTWTGQTHLKTDIGSNELLAYFVVHFMPDPMRGYGCSLKDCIEEQNQVCEVVGDGGHNDHVCSDMTGKVVDWSDVNAFIYFGARIDAGFPFNKHNAEDTGGWVGPLNIIMASGEMDNNDDDNNNNDNDNGNDDNVMKVVDRYVSRYVKSPLTSYLRMPKDCTLLGADDFDKVAGATAVDSTTKGQYDPNRTSDDDDGKDYDPYHAQYKTCANGDVQPLLPLFEFEFEQNTTSPTLEENIQVKLSYKFLSMPNKGDYMYKLFPWVQKQFNKADLGFHISGPYCYGNDPNRGYTFDMNFDTRDPKAMLKLDHGCIEGLPCTPPAADLYNAGSINDNGGDDNGSGGDGGGGGHIIPHVIPEDDGTTIGVGSTFLFGLGSSFLLILLLWSWCMNCKLRKKLKSVTDSHDCDDDDDDEGNDGGSRGPNLSDTVGSSDDPTSMYEALLNEDEDVGEDEHESGDDVTNNGNEEDGKGEEEESTEIV